MSKTIDLIYTYRFIKILTTSWEDMDAFKEGIIDDEGKQLKKLRDLKSSDEKYAYTYFHRMVFNVKRLLEKLPGGDSKIASYAAALFLIKEERNITEVEAFKYLKEDVIGNSVGADNVDMTPGKPKKKPDKFKLFTVPSKVFRRFDKRRSKFERWSRYLNLQDETQQELYHYAKTKPMNTIILKDDTTGAMRSIQRGR
jgi:hypothetical protein